MSFQRLVNHWCMFTVGANLLSIGFIRRLQERVPQSRRDGQVRGHIPFVLQIHFAFEIAEVPLEPGRHWESDLRFCPDWSPYISGS